MRTCAITGRTASNLSKESLELLAVVLLDTFLTILLINVNLAREANPLMRCALSGGFSMFCAAKLAPILVLVALAEWHRKSNPEFTRRALRAGTIAYVTIYFAALLIANLP
jgi:hypothetical protein